MTEKTALIIAIILVLLAGCGPATPAATPAAPVTTAEPTLLPSPTTRPTPAPTSVPAAANTWFKTYGGRQDDVGWGVLPADDGGYYIVGTTAIEFEPQMRGEVYLIRTDAAGEILWEKIYERGGYTEGMSIFRAGDGNLLISGPAALSTTSGTALYLLEVDPAGNELSFKTFDGPMDEMGTAWPLEDGGYLLAGNSVDPNDIVADPGAPGYGGLAGRSNIYLAQADAGGDELWSHTYGGENNVMVFDGLRTPDGGLLLLATIMGYPENDDDIYLLKVDANGNEVWSRTWEEGLADATGLVPTGDGNYLLAGSYSPPEVMDREKTDFMFIKVDPQGNELWKSVWGDPDAGDSASLLAATADGGSIAAGDTGGDLSSWNQDIALFKLDAQGQLLWRRVIPTQTHQMYGQILQHPDGGYVLVGSIARNGGFDIFMIKTDAQGNVTATSKPATAAPTRPPVALSPTVASTPATAGGQTINAETVGRLEKVAAFDLPDSFVSTVVFSPDSRTLIAGDRNGQVLMWERETWEKTLYLPARSTRADDDAAQVWFWGTLALSPDGDVIVIAYYGDDGVVTGRDREGQELFAFSYGARVYSVAISPGGQFLAVGGLMNNVIIFDLETRQPVADLVSDHEYIMNLAFSSDGKTLLASYERPGNSLKTWDTATWQETAAFPHVGERTDYHDVLFSPDGREMVIATIEDVEITFLDMATGQITREFPEHTRAPYQMAFSPDGSLLASASDDGTLRLWDMETGNQVKAIRVNQEAGAVAFSPDGTLIAFSVWGEGVQVWALAP